MSDEDFYKVTGTSVASTGKCIRAQVLGVGSDGTSTDDNASETQDDIETMQPMGLLARPTPATTNTLQAFVSMRGDEVVATQLVDKSRTKQNLADGETWVHGVGTSNQDSVLQIHTDGSQDLTPTSGKDLKLAGGTAKVGRVGDATVDGTLSITAAANTLIVTYTPPSGAPVTTTFTFAIAGGAIAIAGAPLSASIAGQINAGADHVKA